MTSIGAATKAPPPQTFQIEAKDLVNAGFTQQGYLHVFAVLRDYEQELRKRAVAAAQADAAKGTQIEVTQKHVRQAAQDIAHSAATRSPGWATWTQIGEYLGTAAAGVGGGHLDEAWGIATFGIGLTLGVVLFVIRQLRTK